ncbi:unnamed protein product, partial [Brassica rapa subsp. trilocularis]
EREKLHSHRSPSVVGRASHCRYVREDRCSDRLSPVTCFLFDGRPVPSLES